MKILALEFSSPRRSVAVVEGGTVLAVQAEAAGETVPPLRLVERALAGANIEREAIGCLAVGLGPGSYTGIRGAIALAQGWQLAAGVKIAGISSVECIAAQAQTDGIFGNIGVVVDAQRGEYYFAKYEIGKNAVKNTSLLKIVTLTECLNFQETCDLTVGPDEKCEFKVGRVIYPGAAVLGRLAAAKEEFISGDQLEPIYLRATSFVKAPPAKIIPGL
jgi:tRNA threonylcarbamoyl adenosine modification protein YeaZ